MPLAHCMTRLDVTIVFTLNKVGGMLKWTKDVTHFLHDVTLIPGKVNVSSGVANSTLWHLLIGV